MGTIIRGFKGAVTGQVNALRGTPGPGFWQGNYYEHVVRDPEEFRRIQEYIQNSPDRWEMDKENPYGQYKPKPEDEEWRV